MWDACGQSSGHDSPGDDEAIDSRTHLTYDGGALARSWAPSTSYKYQYKHPRYFRNGQVWHMDWSVLRARRIAKAKVKLVEESKVCRGCLERKGATQFDRYLFTNGVRWPDRCWSCGGRRPGGTRAAVGDLGEPLSERIKRRGTSPKFREGYGIGGVGIHLDLFVDALQKAYTFKGMALLETHKGSSKKGAMWALHRTWSEKAEKLKEEFLQKAKWEDEQP